MDSGSPASKLCSLICEKEYVLSVSFIKPTEHFMRKNSLTAESSIQKLNIKFNLAAL